MSRADDRAEWEANWFAVAFLMPEAAFRKEWAMAKGDLRAVAEKFGVSLSHAKARATGLKLKERQP